LGWAAAGAVAAAVALVWIGWPRSATQLAEVALPAPPSPVVAEAGLGDSFRPPELKLVPVRTGPETGRIPASLVELVAAGQSQPSPPRYVLDRIAVTPVSYEIAAANF
jgi:hypothetical protein